MKLEGVQTSQGRRRRVGSLREVDYIHRIHARGKKGEAEPCDVLKLSRPPRPPLSFPRPGDAPLEETLCILLATTEIDVSV